VHVEAYCIAHYGADYIGYALASVEPHVDKIHVVYTPHPSHGRTTDLPCPDTRQAMMDAALDVPKTIWHETSLFWQEGPHRDFAESLCRGDLALVVDCDEVWHGEVLEQALKMAYDGEAKRWRVNFTTPWRSFKWVVTDPLWPDRIIDLRPGKKGYGYVSASPIWHFGYATRTDIVKYKMSIHGHAGEWRPNWFADKWTPWPPVDDLHPTNVNFWYPQPLDRNRLPAIMHKHPFWELEPIS